MRVSPLQARESSRENGYHEPEDSIVMCGMNVKNESKVQRYNTTTTMMLGRICRLSFLVVIALSLFANDKAMVAGDDRQKCPDRSHIIKCAEAHLDTNKNGKLDREELEAAIDSLPWCVNHVSCASVATRNALFCCLFLWFHMFYNYFLERVVYHFSFFRSNTEFTC